MSEVIWDGVTRAETLGSAATARQHLAERARGYDWSSVLAILSAHPEWINSIRPGSSSLYTVLHQAAHGGAPLEVVQQLLARGAWRTLRNAKGERAVDIARHRGHGHLTLVLEPVIKHHVPAGELKQIQQHFHSLIQGRAGDLVREHALRLPELEVLLEMQTPKLWFPVPGMYGGFRIWLERVNGSYLLVTESQVSGGSGQRQIVSPHGSLLIAEGFV